jgi:hypothetical protein
LVTELGYGADKAAAEFGGCAFGDVEVCCYVDATEAEASVEKKLELLTIGLDDIYVKSLPNIKIPKLFGTTWMTLVHVSTLYTCRLIYPYIPMIMMDMAARNAQRRPSHEAREPPSHSWATPVHVSHVSHAVSEDQSSVFTSHRPRYCSNQTRSVIIDVVVRNKLFIGQDYSHDPSVISVEASRKDHAIQQERRDAEDISKSPLMPQYLLPIIFR